MSRLTYIEGLLRNLTGEIKEGRREFVSRPEAYAKLKALTGQDFGYDSVQWRQWFKQHPPDESTPVHTDEL